MKISVAVLILSYCTIQYVAGEGEDFAVTPQTQMVYEQERAIFRCRPTSRDSEIHWRVDGMPVGLNPPLEIDPGYERDENENLVGTLTITATPSYNNSEVVCVSEIGSQSTSTLPAFLRVLPRPSPPQSGFTLTPKSQNATIGATVRFTCEHMDSDVVWRINGQSVNNLRDVTTAGEGGVHILTIRNARRKYNRSEIQCKAVFDEDGRVPEFTSPAILLLQGRLDPVSNVRMDRNTSTLSWTAPFSLDLTDVDPDIAYCVDIYNITCGRRDLIVSDCNVTEPSYTFDASDGYIYEYIVTPRSNVEGARNGIPSNPLRELFSRFSDSISDRNGAPSTNVQLAFLNLEPNRPVPSSYTVILESLDGLEDVMLKTTNITTEGDIVVIDVDNTLPLNRLWNCTLLAYGCRQNTILSNVELSTHDIQNVSISSNIPGQVNVTGEFIQESMASGVLVTIVNATNFEHHLISRDDSRNGIDGVISGLPGGQYTVSVFVVSEDGRPFERVATKPRRITVEDGPNRDHPSPTIEYKLDQTSTGACITCTFLEGSATDCVAVVHQRISQLSSSGLMNIESSHKFTRSGDTAYGCIEINLENYELRVIGGQLRAQASSSICTSTVSCIIGSVFGIIASLAIFTLVVLLVLLRLKKIRYCGKATLPSEKVKYSKKHDIEGGSSSRAVPNPYTEMPDPSNKVGDTPEEMTSVMTGSSDPGETDDPQVASKIPSDSPPVPVVPQAASSESEETVPAAEAEVTKLKLDYSPNPGNKPQYAMATLHEELKSPQVPHVEGAAATGKPDGEARIVTDGDMKAALEDGSTNEEQDQAGDTEMMDEYNLKLKDNTRSDDRSESATHIEERASAEKKIEIGACRPQSTVQDVNASQVEVLSESEEVTEEIPPIDNQHPIEESGTDSTNLQDTTVTIIGEYDSQAKPIGESTPLKEQRPISDASGSVSGQYPIDGSTYKSLLVQNSLVYEYMAGCKVPKSLMPFHEDTESDDASSTCISQPVVTCSKADVHEDDSGYKSCSVPDNLSYSSEPYSVVNDDIESGHDTKLTKKIEIVCNSEKVPVLINDGHDGQQMILFHPNKVHVQPMMENREQQQLGRFFENPENLAGPLQLVPPQQQLSPDSHSD